jgi:hypothetical protein
MNKIILRNFFNKIYTLKGILFILIIIYLIPKRIFDLPDLGLDSSWSLALNMAIKEKLIWGKEIIFTHGPLGYLSTRLPVYASKLGIILFYLFICFNGIYFIYYFFKSINEKRNLVFTAILLFFIGNFIFLTNSLTLYFYFIFHVFHFLKHRNILSFFIVSICCLLSFYVKVNTGIILNILFLLFVLYNYIFSNLNWFKNTLFLLGHFFVLWILSFPLYTDLFSYILNSFSIINSYNDALVMLPLDQFDLLSAFIVFSAIVITIIFSLKKVLKSPYEIILFLNAILLSYIIFKQAFVRADICNIYLFFEGINFVIFLIYLFSNIRKIKFGFYYVIIISALFSISSIKEIRKNVFFEGVGLESYIQPNEIDMSEKIRSRKLPLKIVEEIGDKTVDVLGYEISYIFYNQLKYYPRPIIQSYSSYDSKLINLNCEKYNSETAPNYVLYHFGSIDDRHPFWDEPKIYLALFTNYSIFDTIPATKDFQELILFKKNDIKKTLTENVIKDTVIQLNSKFTIPKSDNILYLMLDGDYTIAGKIRRTLFQPSLVYMDLLYEDKDSTHCRLILPVMKSGVPINKKVIDFNGVYKFFNSKGIDNINANSFVLTGNPRWINNSFRIKIVEYIIEK